MDLLRPRAIPALIAALALPCAAADDCSGLNKTYQYKPANPASEMRMSDLSMSRERSKLFRSEQKGNATSALSSGGLIQRPKSTPLAETFTLIHSAKDTRVRFMDAEGKVLAEMTINDTGRWTCKKFMLERTRERTSGLGDTIRKEKVREVLDRNGLGDLIFSETVSVVGEAGTPPKFTITQFPGVSK